MFVNMIIAFLLQIFVILNVLWGIFGDGWPGLFHINKSITFYECTNGMKGMPEGLYKTRFILFHLFVYFRRFLKGGDSVYHTLKQVSIENHYGIQDTV